MQCLVLSVLRKSNFQISFICVSLCVAFSYIQQSSFFQMPGVKDLKLIAPNKISGDGGQLSDDLFQS